MYRFHCAETFQNVNACCVQKQMYNYVNNVSLLLYDETIECLLLLHIKDKSLHVNDVFVI